jgi:septal ring factor EnvC (AmiA/AmiB activator)
MIKKLFISFLASLVICTVTAQESKEEIQRQQQQLQKELNDLNNTLDEIKKNKKQSLGQLALVQRKIKARTELIRSISKDLRRLDEAIYQNTLEINHLKKELDTLKNNYARSLVFAYRNRSNYDYLNFLFSATSFNDAIKRVAYLKSYRQYRETQVSAIMQTQELLKQKIETLTSGKKEKNTALSEQSRQLADFEIDKKEKDEVVKQLKSQEKDISAQIKTKEKTRAKLNQALQTVIRREREEAQRREKERLAKEEADRKAKLARQNQQQDNANAGTVKPTPKNDEPLTGLVTPEKNNRSYSPFESTEEGLTQSLNFENNRGRLPWPVSSGYVSIHYGPYQFTDKLKGMCDGIEISLPGGSAVKAVADGVVSSVFDLGGEQAVIIRHGKYFTTYSHLSSVTVKRDQEVNAGTVLGRAATGESGDGQVLFMVTNDKGTNLDPEGWLKSR